MTIRIGRLVVAEGEDLVVPRQRPGRAAREPDQADDTRMARVELRADLRPLALDRVDAGRLASQRGREARRRVGPERLQVEVAERHPEPVQGLDLAADDRVEPGRAVGRRVRVGRGRDPGLEQVPRGQRHPAAQAGGRVAEPEDPRVERPKRTSDPAGTSRKRTRIGSAGTRGRRSRSLPGRNPCGTPTLVPQRVDSPEPCSGIHVQARLTGALRRGRRRGVGIRRLSRWRRAPRRAWPPAPARSSSRSSRSSCS